jgi:hypothetical protein
MKIEWRLLKKLKIELPYDPAIPLLGIEGKKYKSGYNKGTCIPMFVIVLFTIVKLWNQPRCTTANDCIKKMWYLHTIEFYSATKKNEISSFAGKWMGLKNTILNDVSQVQKAKLWIFSHICGI